MWSFLFAALLTACTTPPSQTTDAPANAAKTGKNAGAASKTAKTSKEKAAKSDKTQKVAKGDPSKAEKSKSKAPEAAPIGVAGAATGVLSLAPSTEPPPAGATAPPAGPRTEAKLTVTFSDGTVSPVSLGKIAGTCSEKAPTPVGPADKKETPLWAVGCKDPTGKTIDLAVLQKGDAITVLRSVPAPGGGAPEHRVVKRVPLVSGVTLSKKSG
jgi:hypothetical protein